MHMTTSPFYSDRTSGPVPRTRESLSPATTVALHGLFSDTAAKNGFAQKFPMSCPDGRGIMGTDHDALWRNILGLFPDLQLDDYGRPDPIQPEEVVFDLIEYAATRLAKASAGNWHSFYSHSELSFDEQAGRKEFRDEVNQLLERGGTMFELDTRGRICRIGTPEVQQVIGQMLPASGDTELDEMLQLSKTLYLSRKVTERAWALEKLWDAFMRLKTIDVPGDKPKSIKALLSNIADPNFRQVAETEMTALTKLGNDFMIRHTETNTHPVPEDAVDYLFARLGSLINYLLKVSGRLP
jgi:hypothetical protein